VSGPTTDEAMTRSEEELRVGKAERERGRARLRKYVVTEHVQQTVPVRREKVRVEREPITDANVDQALDGPAISDEEHEVVLHEEEPVVEKRAVPKDSVTDEAEISEEVRKERIEASRFGPTKGERVNLTGPLQAAGAEQLRKLKLRPRIRSGCGHRAPS
jgi:uncharacterized protein (TIGR02271 family)